MNCNFSVTSSPFIVACLVAKPLNRSEAEDDLVMMKTVITNDFVIKLTRYWSLSQHGQLLPDPKSKAWQLSTQL